MRAIVLLSGGVDSTVTLALAKSKGCECFSLSFDYGQKHAIELERAKKIAEHYRVPQKVITLDPTLFTSSFLVKGCELKNNTPCGIPSTYVPARNTLFIAYAIAFAESLEADLIFIGANKADHQGYPDCRPAYFKAAQNLAALATKRAVTTTPTQIETPLLDFDKKKILELGNTLDAPLDLTWSCYSPTPELAPCKECAACRLIINLPFSPLKT